MGPMLTTCMKKRAKNFRVIPAVVGAVAARQVQSGEAVVG
jgi:hypothetical protein